MIIAFSKSKRREYFNGNEYPIGTAFTNIYNQMSGLTYNSNFILGSYKNFQFHEYQQQVLKKVSIENKSETIEIENVKLGYEDIKKLISFINLLDEFIRLAKSDKRLNTSERFLFFFTVINKYKIPNEIIEDKELLEKYKKLLKSMLKEGCNCNNIDEHYNNILEHDKKILREVGKSENIIYKYECENFIEVLLISYIYILEQELNLKQCKYCGRFFIAKNGNQEYCNRTRPQLVNESNEDYQSLKISCKEFKKRFPFTASSDDVKKTIRRIRLRILKRIRAGDDTKDYLKKWEKSISEYRKKLFRNEDYIKWLENKSDEHQKRRRKNGSSRNSKK